MNLYKNIEQAIRRHEEILHVDGDVQGEDVRQTIRWVMRDNPDIFWFVHQYYFDQESKTISFRYQFSKERSGLIQKSIEDVVENDFQIRHVCTLGIYEQVMYVYKWLLTYCNYNVNSAYNQNIDSVFVRRNSVCTGYAKAAQYLFKLLGIEARLVFGRLNNDREDGRHCWNIVCIEGTYYHLDVCLGDMGLEDILVKAGIRDTLRYGNFNYNCFCVSLEEISMTRFVEDAGSLPNCNRCLEKERLEALSRIPIKQRNGAVGCLLSHIGSSADIYLCSKNKNIVLKKFRGDDNSKCEEEYGYMNGLRGCVHLIQLNDSHSDWKHSIIAVEQSTPIVDLLYSLYYHPTLRSVMLMIRDIIKGWQECYERGILYRDIHVCNIYKSNSGVYKLGDFGSCTHGIRVLHERVGNQWFMSPETYVNGYFDERSAVYSITAVLYFILNGLRPPFVNGKNEAEALRKKMRGESLPIPEILRTLPKNLSEIIIGIIARGCAYYPQERICSTKDLLMEIRVLLDIVKGNNVDIQISRSYSERIWNDSALDVYIPRDVYHRFAYGENVKRNAVSTSYEEVERMATTGASAVVDIDDEMCQYVDDVENFCRTRGCGEPSFKGSEEYLSSEDQLRKRREELKRKLLEGKKIFFAPNDELITDDSKIKIPQGKLAGGNNFITDTFEPNAHRAKSKAKSAFSRWKRLFHGRESSCDVFSSIFAPAEVKRKSHMLVQLYLHLFEETEKVKALAKESDKNAERRDYTPLQCKLKKGDKVDVLLNIYGESLLKSDKKSVIWQGSFTKCGFDYFVPKDIDVDELSCTALLTVNDIPIGEMRFITKIVESPRLLNPEIIAHKYNKVFISYAHKDEAKVKSFHEGLKLAGIEHFFDRDYLEIGNIFPQVIQDYINSADLFVLFWSENASKSEYVEKERTQALKLAFPQVKPQQAAKLSIYPMSIEPRAELPYDMKDKYHFGII